MAPRTAKAKKNADVKVLETEAPKKGRGKGKNVQEPEQESIELEEDAPVVDKKSKRGKRSANESEQTNGVAEEIGPAPKRGKKKATEETNSNGDEIEAVGAEENDQDDESAEANGSSEIAVANSTGRGRKKQVKKEEKEVKNKGKKGAKPELEAEPVEEKPKGKGRGRKAKVEVKQEDELEEEEKPEPTGKSRKKAQPKAVVEDDENEKTPEDEEEVEAIPKKKETKGRKNVGKKAQTKETEEKDEEIKEEPVTKKKDKAKGDAKDENEDNASEAKPAKGKRGQKKNVETDEVQDTGESVSKRRRKAEEKEAAPKKENKSATNYESIDFSNTSKNPQGKDWNFKIANWNVDGIRAWLGKGGLEYIKHEKPDILCLQEIKCSKDKLPEEITNLPGYHAYWLCSEKDGYAGVGVFTTKLAMNVQYGLQNEEFDNEGRIITAEYEQFYLICTYVPNSGRKLVTLPKRLKWNEEFRNYVKELDKTKPVIICGDMNVAHNEIDLTNPKTNKKNAGFTEEERSGMTELLGDGFVDTYRHFYPDKTGAYTFWSYMFNSRSKNIGWRLDYFIVSERLMPAICDNVIRDKVYGSDHCPISLLLHLSSADKPKE